MRLFRAVIAGWAIREAFVTGEWLLLLPGGLLALQAIFNTGCCGSTACYAPSNTAMADAETPVAIEEVK